MKKLIILGCLSFLATGLWAQVKEGAQIINASQTTNKLPVAITNKDGDAIAGTIQLQVGVPFIFPKVTPLDLENANPNNDFTAPYFGYVNFPWDILYVYKTFSNDPLAFDVSKGYFGDKILIRWEVKNNEDGLKIKIYRRVYTEEQNGDWIFVGDANGVSQYEDKYVDGGVLYEYKVDADNISGNEYLQKYITGIGFRSPTAIVTGNVNYNGGSPVSDVTVTAEADGSAVNLGSALHIKDNGYLSIFPLNKPIENATTMQAWVKPEVPFTNDIGAPISLFSLEDGVNKNKVLVNYLVNSSQLQISVADAIFNIKDYYPTGKVNDRGDDELEQVTNFNASFTHISVVVVHGSAPKLYINGRPMTKAYQDMAHDIEGFTKDAEGNFVKPYATFAVSEVTQISDLNTTNNDKWNNIKVGGGHDALIDEVRIWNAEIDVKKIRTDYKRYITGNDARLISYLRADEGLGKFAYDYSREGFNYNKNHGKFGDASSNTNTIEWKTGAGNIPTASQLGVLGVTDANGNYEISSIPYSGTGESFTITPSYGLHQFQPNKKLVFLGEGSTVVNEINFIDKSSFIFKGKVLYDTRDVFVPFTDQISGGASIKDDGYNTYTIDGIPYAKGQYWLNEGADPDSETDDTLDEYAQIFVGGANVYIDGQIVLDENNIPVVTNDIDGTFSVNVPIGKHYITVKKNGHVFEFNGRYPEASTNPDNHFAEFFQNREDQVVFIDKTRVTVVGRVVGGAVEAQKEIGFGQDGIFEEAYTDANGNITNETISSLNNIGEANITFNYPDHDKVQPETKFTFQTNIDTGEFRVEVLPITYSYKSTDINIINNTDNLIIGSVDANSLNFTDVPELITPEFESENIVKVTGEPYHYKQSFNYRAIPVLNVINQESEESVDINGEIFFTDGFEFPIYRQNSFYNIELRTFEKYTNYDGAQPVESIVPVIDGELIVNNNLALDGTETYVTNPEDASFSSYTFKAGVPSFSANTKFVKSLSIKYRVDGNDYDPIGDYKKEGIVLGGASDGPQTFVTSAPDVPDIILRDPPGSNSFASIEAGQSMSFNTSNSFTDAEGVSQTVDIEFGSILSVAGGVTPMPVTTATIEDGLTLSASVNYTSTNGNSVTKTYTFNQTISTSDDPDWVGADADLYIGNSINYFYSSFNKLQVNDAVIGDTAENIPLLNSRGETVYLSVQKGFAMSPDPSNTFFVFSQRYILKDLIPEYESIIEAINLPASTLIPGENGVLTVEEYERQISVWKKVVLKNELDKYIALDPKWRTQKKELLKYITAEFNKDLIDVINDSDDPSGESNLKDKLAKSERIKDLLDEYYSQNISFDSGVGEISRSVETATIIGNSTEYDITLDESIALTFGGRINGTGIVSETSGFFQQDINTALSSEDETTTTFSYTIKDNDEANLLSLDITNEFGDYGPVFSTQGGRTSCPQEGPELSNFFTKSKFETYVSEYLSTQKSLSEKETYKRELVFNLRPRFAGQTSDEARETRLIYEGVLSDIKILETKLKDLDKALIADISCCEDQEKATLSYGTQKVEVPLLSVEIGDVSNIPENKNAEFTLLLENNSASGTDADFLLKIDNTTNPNNAITNIEQNGTIVHVPYGGTTLYKLTLAKSISDVYDYEDIRVVLQSLCDGEDVSASVLVSASFVPSCSSVMVSAPVNNWVYNINEAYNTDGTTKPLNINLNGFNTTFDSFQKIDLQYRLATSPNWTNLQTYYATEELRNSAILAGATESQISVIDGASLTFAFDIADRNLQDGKYEIRAKSSCSNGTEFISDVITGSVDLNAPERFGTPLPIDGILGAGEDFKVSFNENIFYNTAISKIEILGATNQLPINNNVSLYFEGANNTVTIEKPRIVTGDFSLEFWMNNATVASSATLLSQTNGLNIGLVNGQMSATLGGINATGFIATDNLFHHYTITHNNATGSFSIYEDDAEIAGSTGAPNAQFTNSNTLVIGGNSFIGNIHDLRLWSKSLTLSNAYANIYTKIIGNENSLLGYWPMDEGRGAIANDLAFFKHGNINASWDIKPKGGSYEFSNGQYLELDQMGFTQLTNTMDATISFWIKTDVPQEATIFSNGKGDGTDPVQSNGLNNKWAINISSAGTLSFQSEGTSYALTLESIADNKWHHVALLLNRLGSLRTYIDAKQVTSNSMATIGGFSGNTAWLGAREYKDLAGVTTVDREFSGKIDEFRLWNTLRDIDQIDRDRFNEVDNQSIGLMLYARMNAPTPSTGNGPRYFHTASSEDNIPDDAILKAGAAVNYANDVPAIKPERNLIKFEVSHVINQDNMIIEPIVSDWAVLEGQVLDVTVHRMFDASNNRQESPITWTAFIQQNDVNWYADGYTDIVDIVMNSQIEQSFDIVIINRGGNPQPYNIANIPGWMSLSSASGTIAPDSQIKVTATIDAELANGEYLENLSLQTDFGFDQKLQVNLRVLAEDPDWIIDPNAFDYTMNIVGKIKVDGTFSDDLYDRVAAISNGEIRGSVNLIYQTSYQEYFVFLTVYSNSPSGDAIEFRIWDASDGNVLHATLGGNASVSFLDNQVIGTLNNSQIFENTDVIEQEIILNQGWTWISANVNDLNFSDLNALTQGMQLETSDRILSHSPSLLETYYKDDGQPLNSTWNGTVSSNGGMSSRFMYKINTTHGQPLALTGSSVDINSWSFPLQTNWNWVPFPLNSNVQVNEALASFNAQEGNVIKSQNLFAIYDEVNGWSGTLNYLAEGQGYMLKSSDNQTLEYPNYFGRSAGDLNSTAEQLVTAPEFTQYAENMNAVVLMPSGYNNLFVYDANGILKGQVVSQVAGNKELSFITIYGELPEELIFHIGNGLEIKPTTKVFSFKSNQVLGTVADPVILEDETLLDIIVSPNPFETYLNIKINSTKGQVVSLQIHNMLGQLVFSDEIGVQEGENDLRIVPNLSLGTYFLNVNVNTNNSIFRVIKK